MNIQKSIIKKFRKEIWSPFVRAIKDYQLIQEGDKIAVCISGGKDSMLLAKCLEELQRHGMFKFEVTYIVMDPGYNEENLNQIKKNLAFLELDAHIFKTDVFAVAEKSKVGNPCYLCAKMRRGFLYDKAQQLGCNKIALGHHFDDIIETIMLNMFYTGNYKTMMPKLKSTNFKGMELIRPLYYIREEAIIKFANYHNLKFLGCGCEVTNPKTDSKREEIKALIKQLKLTNKDIDKSIFRSSENINLDAIIAYQKNGEKISFLDDYDD